MVLLLRWNLIFTFASLILSHTTTLADSSFRCDDTFKRYYIKSGSDQNIPVYRFTKLHDNFLSDLNSETDPEAS